MLTKSTHTMIAELIENELGYTNGWKIPDKDYSAHCKKIANQITKMMTREARKKVPKDNLTITYRGKKIKLIG